MEHHREISSLAENIERHVSVLLRDIERQKKAILAKAKEDALIELHNAKKLSQEIIDRTILHTRRHFDEIKSHVTISQPISNLSDTQKFILDRSIQNLEMHLKEINQS
jgi:inorganic pyrophosphatase